MAGWNIVYKLKVGGWVRFLEGVGYINGPGGEGGGKRNELTRIVYVDKLICVYIGCCLLYRLQKDFLMESHYR